MKALKSESVIVLMMNFWSWEKKKNEPDLPCDSPALKTFSLLFSGASDISRVLLV